MINILSYSVTHRDYAFTLKLFSYFQNFETRLILIEKYCKLYRM